MSGEPENFLLLMDPEWQASPEQEAPPFEAVVGMWPMHADGSKGKFRSNPEYQPRNAGTPTDPIDALLRLIERDEAEVTELQVLLHDSLVDLAMNGDGNPLIIVLPDDGRAVVVTTSYPLRRHMPAPDWWQAHLDDLVRLLPPGTDVVLNPGAPGQVRLTAEALHATAALSADEVAALRAEIPDGSDNPRKEMRLP